MASLVSIVESALAGVSSANPDAVRVMAHGAEAGNAIKSSSVVHGGEAASESGAVEKSHVIVTASDFPTLSADALVTLADVPHVVTSLRTDPLGASMVVGLSDCLSAVEASVSGVRGSRSLRFPIGLLAVNNGLATDLSDGFAPTSVHSWTLCVSCDQWPDAEAPNIGDEFRFAKAGEDVRVKVTRCNKRDGFFILDARSR